MTDSHSSHTKDIADLLECHWALISPNHSAVIVLSAINPVLAAGIHTLHIKTSMLREARRSLDYIGSVVFDRYILNHSVSLITFVTIQSALNMYTRDILEKNKVKLISGVM